MEMRTFILLALSALVAPGCRAARLSEAQAVVPELKLEGVTFRAYHGESIRAYGLAKTATLRRDSSVVHAEELDATLPRGTAPVRITAPEGDGSLLSRVFEVSGGIVATRLDEAARTARARYDPADNLVRGRDPVTVEGPGYRLQGTGFTLDPSAGTVMMSDGATLVAGLRGARAP